MMDMRPHQLTVSNDKNLETKIVQIHFPTLSTAEIQKTQIWVPKYQMVHIWQRSKMFHFQFFVNGSKRFDRGPLVCNGLGTVTVPVL